MSKRRKPSEDRPRDGGLIVFKYTVRWETFRVSGEKVDSGNRSFETKKEAEEFANKLKKSVGNDMAIHVVIVQDNQIVRRFKKSVGRRNATNLVDRKKRRGRR